MDCWVLGARWGRSPATRSRRGWASSERITHFATFSSYGTDYGRGELGTPRTSGAIQRAHRAGCIVPSFVSWDQRTRPQCVPQVALGGSAPVASNSATAATDAAGPQLDHLARADHTHAWRALGAEESVSRRRPGDADAGTARRCSDGVLPACRCCGCANTVAQWRGYTRGVPGHAYIRRTPLDRAVFRARGTLRGADVQRTGARAHPQGPWDGRNVCVPRVSAA